MAAGIVRAIELSIRAIARGLTSVTLLAAPPLSGEGPYTYQWYRSQTSGFTPGAGNILSGKTTLSCADSGLTQGTAYYYKMVATDSVAATFTSPEKRVRVTRLIVCDGNSLTFGTWASNLSDGTRVGAYPVQMMEILPDAAIINIGVGGQTTVEMNADRATQLATYYTASCPCIVVPWELTNDLYLVLDSSGNPTHRHDGTAAYNELVTYWSGARSAGWKVVAATGSMRDAANHASDSLFEASRLAANALVNSNWRTYCDALAPIGEEGRLNSGVYSSTYFNDGPSVTPWCHYTDNGYRIVAEVVAAAVQTIS